MTYNVFSGTLNPTQSINQSRLIELRALVIIHMHSASRYPCHALEPAAVCRAAVCRPPQSAAASCWGLSSVTHSTASLTNSYLTCDLYSSMIRS